MNFFNWLTSDASKREALENKRKTSMLDAIERTQAVVEFDLKGIVLSVNDNFLSVMGYDSQDVIGKHHSMFVEPAYKASDAYREFWQQLNVGDALSDVYKRIGQGGKEVWIQASYNPLLDATGKVTGVVKYATDVTEQKVRSADYSGQIDAIRKSQAVIEFNMDGIVEFANDNFLKTLDYTLDEIKGKHHSMFVAPEYKNSHTYREFWENLNAGIYSDDEIKRFGNGGKEIWLQAFYNPILDLNGKPFKVVKYATEVTQQKFQTADFSGQIAAISKAQAIIEFDMDGIVQAANDKFLNAMGYTLAEVKGKHHSMFVAPEYKSSHTYREFWENLNAGIYATDEIKRFGNGGKEIWLQASYNPILDLNGKPFKVVKYATDVTEQKFQIADFSGQIDAIGKAQAVVEFDMDGIVLAANDKFLDTLGYTLDEIKGKHHSMFVAPEYKKSHTYREFWENLNAGLFSDDEIKRFGNGGKEIWLQAFYNPILDLNGKPFKVVKYATEVTQQKLQAADFSGQIDAISKAQAVIEYDMDGIIQTANDNFLNCMGYTLGEIKGKHQSIFVDSDFRNSHDYRTFWEQLNAGVFTTGEYKRIGKVGNEIFIQASYNPIFDLNGKPFKVVKYATDITSRKEAVNEIKRVLLRLSSGDLTTRIEKDFKGEFVELGESITSFISDLTNTITQINGSVKTIRGAAGEIAQGNIDLSSRTEQQASNLEETASTMEELTGTVRLNAENAKQANGLASQASTVASEGGDLIQQVVSTMSSINESARKISDIIGVIDGIAFQTNILALNAAVEAARAGEQGRGFAVVASEVRSLAQRSANAAKDIKELISDSVSKIENGNTLVNRSGETMGNVVTSIKQVNDLMAEIAEASAEQASGIDEVGKAINQMDEVTQQNAALVEEAAAAAESLQSQSEELSDRVATFTLEASDDDERLENKKRSQVASRETQRPRKKARIAKSKSPEEDEWETF